MPQPDNFKIEETVATPSMIKNLVGDKSVEEEPKKLVESASVKHIQKSLGKSDMSAESVFEAAIGNTLEESQEISTAQSNNSTLQGLLFTASEKI